MAASPGARWFVMSEDLGLIAHSEALPDVSRRLDVAGHSGDTRKRSDLGGARGIAETSSSRLESSAKMREPAWPEAPIRAIFMVLPIAGRLHGSSQIFDRCQQTVGALIENVAIELDWPTVHDND